MRAYDGRSFGEAIAFENFATEAHAEGNAEIGGKLLGATHDSAQGAEGVARNTLEVMAQEGRRRQEHRGSVSARGLGEFVAIEGRGRGDDRSPRDQRKEESHREAEAVEERQRCEETIAFRDEAGFRDLEDVRNKIAIAERNTLG